MADKKIIAVAGATGAQGGGLVRAITSDAGSEFAARALTRDASSDKAKALADGGAEVVEADLDDLASVEAAFAGAYGAYCVTFFWEHFSADIELAQAKNMAAAAKSAGLQHVIASSLEDTRNFISLDDDRMPTLQGKYKVPHYDSKGDTDQAYIDAGVPLTVLRTSFYWDNMIMFGMGPKRNEEGKLVFALPMGDKRLPGIAAEDIGKVAYGIFKRGSEFIGKTVGIAGEHLTGAEFAAIMSKVYEEGVTYYAPSPDEYRSYGFPGADDLGNMFQFKQEFEADYVGARDIERTRQLDPELLTFEEWLTENKDRIPQE
jgi:uncharacterized protein YbjT (DUF2867 family)